MATDSAASALVMDDPGEPAVRARRAAGVRGAAWHDARP